MSFPSNDWGFMAMIADGNQETFRMLTFDNNNKLDDDSGGDSQFNERNGQLGDTLLVGHSTAGDELNGDLDFFGFSDSKLTEQQITDVWEATKR
jgi:hypothetical protein